MFKILSIEDDSHISQIINHCLNSKQHQVFNCSLGTKALNSIEKYQPDLILLDWMLSDIDGIYLIKKIRSQSILPNIPIILLTAKAEISSKVKALNKGADDYMTKPFSCEELNARIHCLLRRIHGFDQQGQIILGKININPNLYQLSIKNKIIKISLPEFKLLYFLIKHKNQVFSRNQLMDQIWGRYSVIDQRTVDVNILRVRKILQKHSLDKHIETVRGLGYCFKYH